MLPKMEMTPDNIAKSDQEVNHDMVISLLDNGLEPLEDRLTDNDLKVLVKQMRSPGGVLIQDRHYRLNIYPACFIVQMQ
jgi:potassium efflux system protein